MTDTDSKTIYQHTPDITVTRADHSGWATCTRCGITGIDPRDVVGKHDTLTVDPRPVSERMADKTSWTVLGVEDIDPDYRVMWVQGAGVEFEVFVTDGDEDDGDFAIVSHYSGPANVELDHVMYVAGTFKQVAAGVLVEVARFI
jgi:hypothetical protein